MENNSHNFNKSIEFEKSDQIISLQEYCMKKYVFERYRHLEMLSINRESCNHNDPNGKLYQKADTDVIYTYKKKNKDKSEQIKKLKVSEKTRQKNYNDILIELISVLKINDSENYIPGWGTKDSTEHPTMYQPDSLSYLIYDEKNDKIKHIFIKNIQKFKEELFQENEIKQYLNKKFINSCLKNIRLNSKKQKNFSIQMEGPIVNNIIFAHNSGTKGDYYTISISVNINYIKDKKNLIISEEPLNIRNDKKNNKTLNKR